MKDNTTSVEATLKRIENRIREERVEMLRERDAQSLPPRYECWDCKRKLAFIKGQQCEPCFREADGPHDDGEMTEEDLIDRYGEEEF